MNEPGGKTTLSAYVRLTRYARTYKARLAIGILSGCACASANFGILSTIPRVVQPMESAPATALEPADPAPEAGLKLEKKGIKKLVPSLKQSILKQAERWGIGVSKDSALSRRTLVVILLVAPPLIFLRCLAMYLNRYHMRWVGSRVVRDIRDQLFSRLQSQSLKFFGRNDVGQMISNCTNDAAVVEQMLSVTVADLTRAPFEIAASLVFVVLFTIENRMLSLLAIALVVFPLCIVPIAILGRRLKRYSHSVLGRISMLVSRMHENFTGIRVVKAYHMEKKEDERFRSMNKEYFRSTIRALRAELLMHPMMEAVASFLALGFLGLCYMKGITFGQIAAVGMAGVMAYKPIKGLVQINANLQRGAAALDRIFAVLDTDTALKESPHPVVVSRFADGIMFEAVDFRYAEEGDLTVRDISFEIPRGHVVAVVGETGSGKTTLANLLARFYDPTAGRILLDGVDLRDIEVASLRKLIGVVTQETILFNETITSNIAYGTEGATPEAVEQAARKANAHEFIVADPAAYDRVVGEKGFVLSGGERQRLAIARAILKNPPILILDEATSALDTVTERSVQQAINQVMKDRTVFAIAHRLSTVKHADLILLLDKGRIVERGTHEELYAAGGRYRQLCDMQVLDG